MLLFYNALMAGLALNLPDPWRARLRWLLPLAVGLLPLHTPLERLLAMSLYLLFALKGVILLGRPRAEVRAMNRLGLALYLTVWPGTDPGPLSRRSREVAFPARWFVQGWVTMVVSGVAAAGLAVFGRLNSWAVLAAILGFVHLGYSDVLSALLRLAGFPVRRLFDNPLASLGLRDFWSRRWNMPFVEMNRVLFMPALQPRLGRARAVLAAFLLSGLLHELALSFPVRQGWGGPLLYFVLQGLAMRAEGARFRRLPRPVRLVWTWAWLFLPLGLLFHAPFRQALIQPLVGVWPEPLPLMLKLAGFGHFLVLAASFQVPHRLGWHEELSRLRPLNRKLLWVYGGFIVGLITSFGALILALQGEMLAGERGARALLGLIAVFWTARILVDAVVFEHDDWPAGAEFVMGHTLLTSLFVYIAATAWLVVLS